jgi:hypothetical protein
MWTKPVMMTMQHPFLWMEGAVRLGSRQGTTKTTGPFKQLDRHRRLCLRGRRIRAAEIEAVAVVAVAAVAVAAVAVAAVAAAAAAAAAAAVVVVVVVLVLAIGAVVLAW